MKDALVGGSGANDSTCGSFNSNFSGTVTWTSWNVGACFGWWTMFNR